MCWCIKEGTAVNNAKQQASKLMAKKKNTLHLEGFGWPQTDRIRSIQNAQQAIRHSSVIFVAPYWNYRRSCLKVQLAPLAQDADSEKWNISLDYVKKKGLSPDLEYFRLPTSKRSRLIIIMPSHCYWS